MSEQESSLLEFFQRAKRKKTKLSREKIQVSTSEGCRKNHFSTTERGRNSTWLSLLVVFRGAAYLKTAEQAKIGDSIAVYPDLLPLYHSVAEDEAFFAHDAAEEGA